ncbi:hypothetical protein MMC31_002050 [Peltigera leucophlebia]|nr:hypothetical protein [Peltigera leucophlebia]
MGFLSNPKLPYGVRIAELVFGLVFLILICYAGVHRGWWTNINGALAVGVITSVITFGVTGYGIFLHHRQNPFAGGSKLATLARVFAEIITALLWVATATLMLRHKGGCENRSIDGIYCRANKKWVDRPLVTWTVAIAFSFVQIVLFVLSAALAFVESRRNRVSGSGA